MKFSVLIFCCLLLLACKKNPFDYRTKFTGDYIFHIEASSHSGIPPNYTHKDTSYVSNGKIELTDEENTILISISGGGSSKLTIYEDGTLEGGSCLGEFESTTKVKYNCFYASPASNTSTKVNGDKK